MSSCWTHQYEHQIANTTSDYDVFMSPLSDFKKEVEKAGLTNKVVYLDRKDQFKFAVKN